MIYIFDSYYIGNEVTTACVGITDWEAAEHQLDLVERSPVESEYVSGQFYKRELPGILQLAERLDLQSGDILLVDGYVYLDDQGAKGLGAYLYEALGERFAVLGVAKKKYHSLQSAFREVYRGESRKPLYVTSLGFDLDEAQAKIEKMAGPFRIPTALKTADQLSKGHELSS